MIIRIENRFLKLSIVLFFVLIIRIAIIFIYGPTSIPGGGDHNVYHSAALELTKGISQWKVPSGEFGYRAPLYFVFLAGIYYNIQNPKYIHGQLTSALIGTLNCLLIFLLALRIYNEKVAWISLCIRGFLPQFIITDTFILSEGILLVFLLLILLLISKNNNEISLFQSIAIGVFSGLCVLTREAASIYPLIFGIFILFNTTGTKYKIFNTMLFVLALATILSPWLWRNKMVWGSSFPISYTTGVNVHIGNNPYADGRYIDPPSEGLPANVKYGTPDFNDWHLHQGLKYIKENPYKSFTLGFKKIAWLLYPRFLRYDIRSVYYFKEDISSIISIICGITGGLFILLGGIAFIYSKHDWYWKIVLSLIFFTLAITFIVVGDPRYRDPIDNLLIVSVALLLARISDNKYENIKEKLMSSKYKFCIASIFTVFIVLNWLWAARQQFNI